MSKNIKPWHAVLVISGFLTGLFGVWRNEINPPKHEGVQLSAESLARLKEIANGGTGERPRLNPNLISPFSIASTSAPETSADTKDDSDSPIPSANNSSTTQFTSASTPSDKNKDNKEETEEVSDVVSISRFYYMRYLNATTKAEKIGYLFLSVRVYGEANQNTVGKAANGLKMTVPELCQKLRTAAVAHSITPAPLTTSQYDSFNYWNDRALFQPYINIDSLGNPQTDMALKQIFRERFELYFIGAAQEILPSVINALKPYLSNLDKEGGMKYKRKLYYDYARSLSYEDIEDLEWKLRIIDGAVSRGFDMSPTHNANAQNQLKEKLEDNLHALDQITNEIFIQKRREEAKKTKFNPNQIPARALSHFIPTWSTGEPAHSLA